MRTGVATVATAIGGFPDLISDGQTGCLVPPRSPEVLADVLCKLIDDQAQRMRLAEAGRARAFTLLDPTVNAIRVDAALRAAMDGRDAPQE
jgi:glycosyltransferase involved in cell wall biosynthesis